MYASALVPECGVCVSCAGAGGDSESFIEATPPPTGTLALFLATGSASGTSPPARLALAIAQSASFNASLRPQPPPSILRACLFVVNWGVFFQDDALALESLLRLARVLRVHAHEDRECLQAKTRIIEFLLRILRSKRHDAVAQPEHTIDLANRPRRQTLPTISTPARAVVGESEAHRSPEATSLFTTWRSFAFSGPRLILAQYRQSRPSPKICI